MLSDLEPRLIRGGWWLVGQLWSAGGRLADWLETWDRTLHTERGPW